MKKLSLSLKARADTIFRTLVDSLEKTGLWTANSSCINELYVLAQISNTNRKEPQLVSMKHKIGVLSYWADRKEIENYIQYQWHGYNGSVLFYMD
jgi:hypothetical protein